MSDPLAQKCKARNRQGKRCGNWAIPGGTVCRFHGGKAPQVEKAALERLRELQHPAIAQLARIIEDPVAGDTDKLRAIENVLDRTGIPRNAEVTVSSAKDALLEKLRAMREN